MIALIICGSIAALITGVLVLKVGMRVTFGSGFRLWIVIGPVKKELKFGGSKKTEEPTEEDEPEEEKSLTEETPKAAEDEKEEVATDKKSGKSSILERFDKKKLIKLAFRALKELLKLPRIDIFEFNYVAGGKTADKAAMAYGKMCAAVGTLLPFMRNYLRVKTRKINTDLDINSLKSHYSGTLQITVTIGAVVAFGLWIVIEVLKCRKKKEGKNEQYDSRPNELDIDKNP